MICGFYIGFGGYHLLNEDSNEKEHGKCHGKTPGLGSADEGLTHMA